MGLVRLFLLLFWAKLSLLPTDRLSASPRADHQQIELANLSKPSTPKKPAISKQKEHFLAEKISSKKAKLIRRYLKRAESLYDRSEYEAALVIFAKVLKLEDSHPVARLKMAKSLYKIARFDDAFRMFRIIGLSNLDPDSAYEYAQSALKTKDFEVALSAFEAIPQGHPLFDLANYYGAICAANLKRYEKARDLMKQALVLPSKLVASRKAYMSHFEEVLQREQKQRDEELAAERENQAQKNSGAADQAQAEFESKPNPAKTLWNDRLIPQNRIAIGLEQTDQALDFNEQRTLNQSAGRFYIHLDLNPQIDLSDAKDQSSIWLSTMNFHLQLKNKNTIIHPVAGSVLDEQIERLETAYQSVDAPTLFAAHIKTGPAWKSQNSTLTHLGAELLSTIQEFDSSKSLLQARAFLALGFDRNNLQGFIHGAYGGAQNNGTQEFTLSELILNLKWYLGPYFRLNGHGRFQQFSYIIANTNGPDWNLRTALELGYSASQRLQILLGAHSDIISGQRLHEFEGIEVVGFDQSNTGGHLSIQASVWNRLQLNLSAKAENRLVSNLTPDNNETRNALATAYASYITTMAVSVGYNQSF